MTEEARLAAEREAKIKELEGVLAEEAAQLSALEGPLRFGRIPSTDSSVFFGSIGPVDVVEALRAKQIFVEEGSVEGEKVRTFGSHTFKVKLGLREATVDIFVEREEPGKESAAAQP